MKFNILKDFPQKIVISFKSFPIASIFAIVTALLFIYIIEFNSHNQTVNNLILTTILGYISFISIRFIGSKTAYIIGVILLIGYYYTLPTSDFSYHIVYREIGLFFLFLTSIFWAKYIKAKPDNLEFWEWTSRKGIVVSN